MTPDIIGAARLAANAHQGQVRRYTGEPYILHPGRVTARLSYHPLADEALLCASWCHDVLEDCDRFYAELLEIQIGAKAFRLVNELTNPSKQHPGLPRAERKALDRAHLAHVSRDARLIKLADRADNVRDLCRTVDQCRDFAKTYWDESWQLARVLIDVGTDDELETELISALDQLDSLLP